MSVAVEMYEGTFVTGIRKPGGFGWMMDVREQLQGPVIPPDPRIVPDPLPHSPIPDIVGRVHQRLLTRNPLARQRI